LDSRLCDRGSFTYEELEFSPFRESGQVRGFTCGDRDLDDFLTTEEVVRYERERLGRTWLVYVEGELVGYYTLAQGSLNVQYVRKGKKSFNPDNEWIIEEIPALKLGRFAVRKDLHRKGLGRLLMDHIKGLAINAEFPCRLIVLNAVPDSIEFYQSCEFELSEHHKMKNRVQRVMFYDLNAIRDVA
jgi:GNAT superfamily N-acetyltransferase